MVGRSPLDELTAVEIREYIPDDRDAVIDLLVELQAFERQFSPTHAAPDRAFASWYLDRLLRVLQDTDGVLFIAAHEHEGVCGFVAAYPEEETEARGWYFYISDLVVGAQQRAHGIGSKLLRVMEHVARSRNFKTLGIGVLAGSDRVHALYHRLGFQDYAMTLRKHL